MYTVLAAAGRDVIITSLGDDGEITARSPVARPQLAAEVARLERARPRWVWSDTARWYPPLLEAGVRVDRCVDLRLCHAILRNSQLSEASALAASPPSGWDAPAPDDRVESTRPALFEVDVVAHQEESLDPVAEFALQRAAVTPRLALLLAAESAGALVAAEIKHAGLPWRADLHEQLLTRTLGDRPAAGTRPARMAAVLSRLRVALDAPDLNPDSPVELMRALRRAGLMVSSTRSWELEKVDHAAIPPLLEYKKLARLLAANGWHWLDTNIRDGRFRPDYVPGGVVTGRWASKGGGGALQLPKQIRGAVVADPGWKLVVADASQLEPRILAALAGDRAMVEAGSAGDLYAGIVSSGAVATREQAKVAMLGAMYGATSGESGRLMPGLTRAYPRAIGLVESAARAGERGEKVSTRLGRSSPLPGPEWADTQALAGVEGAGEQEQSQARSQARTWGRFTRNFVVQGTAAEWALCWMATLRGSLFGLRRGGTFAQGPHLVFFMHDEVVVHTPADQADAVVEAIHAAAGEAGRLLFGELPVQFPLSVAVVDDYGQAK